MEQDVSKSSSKVPHHLRPFQRPSLTVDPTLIENKALTHQTSPSASVELCPSHWRLPPKRSLKSTLKDILLKEWPRPTPHTPPRSISHERPAIMRMKDSDDYLTARAANPWTGLISPSVGTLTPRLLDTPDSPGVALHIKKKDLPASPTPDGKERPPLRRANEGRKVSSGSNKLWKADENGWITETAVAGASPKVTNAEAGGGLVSSRSQPLLNEDTLVVHMPSAQEPQPYAYPGYSAKQIEAIEYYKRKARRVSSEGYDKRILHTLHQPSAGATAGICKISTSNQPAKIATGCKVSHPTRQDSPVVGEGHITVAKRRPGDRSKFDRSETSHCHPGAELQANNFAPFSSPRTPATRGALGAATELGTSHVEHVSRSGTVLHIHRRPADINRHSPSDYVDDLKKLPRVCLVHPALAGVPKAHPQRQMENEGVRMCSLGCPKERGSGVCVERRIASTTATPSNSQSLFDQRAIRSDSQASEPQVEASQTQQLLEIFATAIISIVDGCRHVIMPLIPHIGLIDVLRAEDRTPQQKLDALKSMMSTVG